MTWLIAGNKKPHTICEVLVKAHTIGEVFVKRHTIGEVMVKPHTIHEVCVKPAALKIAGTMLGQKEAMKLNSVPLSAKVVIDRISTFAQNVQEQVLSYINASKCFAIQLDETIDVSSNAQPMVYEQQSPSKDVPPPFGGML